MSACDPFSVSFQGVVADYLEKIKGKIAKMNGTLTGNETEGSFEVNSMVGRVAGTYIINGQTVTVTVTDKPLMLACAMLEGILKGVLS
ncbi:MAG: hypothetical protein ACLQQ4_00190 [Bacteroidia bacterium]